MNTSFTGSPDRFRFANFSHFIKHPWGRWCAVSAVALAVSLFLGAPRLGTAQSVSFVGAQTTVPALGLHCPRGVAVDGSGNVFIADSNDSRVLMVPAGGGAQFTVGIGLNGPNGVTVDAKGNIFIADSRNNRAVVIPVNGGAQYTVGSGLSDPGGVAVDGAGNVYIADTANRRVVVVPANGGGQYTVGSGLRSTRDVALDKAGNLYIADNGNGRVVVVPANGGDQYTVGTGLSNPSGVVLDGAGNIFISDPNNSRVVEVPAGGGAQTTLPTSGLFYPYGVAVDKAGDVFIVDHAGTVGRCPLPGKTSQVVEWQRTAVNYGSVIMQSSSMLTLNYEVAATTTFGPVDGGPQSDFTLGAVNTCKGTLSAHSPCMVNITFAPTERGVREATIKLTDSSGNTLVSTAVQGNGVATTATTLTSSPNPSKAGEAVTFTATVTSSAGMLPDGETVSFVHGTTILGTGTSKAGLATLTISTLPVGGTTVTAVYGGDTQFAQSTSNRMRQVVKGAGM